LVDWSHDKSTYVLDYFVTSLEFILRSSIGKTETAVSLISDGLGRTRVFVPWARPAKEWAV